MPTDCIEVATYLCVVLSVIAAISNIVCYFYTKKTFNENTPYRILRIECVITTLCQLGFISVLLGSLQESPYPAMCISASSVAMFDHSILYVTRSALSRARYNAMEAYRNGNNAIPTDPTGIFYYTLNLTLTFLFFISITSLDYYGEFKAVPPLEFCYSRVSQNNSQKSVKGIIFYSVALSPYFLIGLGNMGYSWSLFRLFQITAQRIRQSVSKQTFREFIFSIILLCGITILFSPNYYYKRWTYLNNSVYMITVCTFLLIADILKAPLTIKLTFGVNQNSQRRARNVRRATALEHVPLERLNNASAVEGSLTDNPLLEEEHLYSDPEIPPPLSDSHKNEIPDHPFSLSDIPYIDESE